MPMRLLPFVNTQIIGTTMQQATFDVGGWSNVLAVTIVILLIVALIGMIAYRLYRSTRGTSGDNDVPATLQAATLPIWFGVLVILIYSLAAHASLITPRVSFAGAFSVTMAVAGAAFLIGGFAGFLFGIPKSKTAAKSADPTEVDPSSPGAHGRIDDNTNIEDISDWLTKILIGVGLVQLREIGPALEQFGRRFRGLPFGDIFVVAVSLLFAISGFFVGYFSARLFLPGAFHRSQLQRLESEVALLRKQDVAIRTTLLGPQEVTGVSLSSAEADLLRMIAEHSRTPTEYVDLKSVAPNDFNADLLRSLREKNLIEADSSDPHAVHVRVTGLGAVSARAPAP